MEDHAIVVGISRYPQLGALDGPELDAADFHKWVTSPNGGNVPNAVRILSSDFPVPPNENAELPTAAAVEDELEKLWARGQKDGQFGGRLYLYFAGHGIAQIDAVRGIPHDDDAALLMANAAKGRFHHVAGRTYADYFRYAAFFREVVLIMDCCREHQPKTPLRGPVWDSAVSDTPASICYAFSTDWNREAREAAWRPGDPVRGLFSLALMNVLRGGGKAGTTIDGTELRKLVLNEMRRIAGEFATTQAAADAAAGGPVAPQAEQPTYDQDASWVIKGGAIQFRPSIAGAVITATLSAAKAGRAVRLRDGALNVIAPSSSTPTEWKWTVDQPGLYVADVDDGTRQEIQLPTLQESPNVSF